MPKTLVDIEKLEGNLQSHKSNIETSIQKLLKEQSTKAEEEIKNLKAALEDVTKSITQIQENTKTQNQLTVQGLEEDLKKNPFSWSRFVTAALKERTNKANPWVDAGHEKEIIDNYEKKDHIAGDGTQGGYLVPEEVTSEVVDMTIANMPVMEMGVTSLPGLVGDLPIPRMTSRNTGYWLGETEPPTESTGAFDQFTLRPKKAGAFTKFSRRLSYQTRGAADALIKQNISDSLALLLDLAYLSGTGTASQPKGILTQTGYTVTPNLATNAARFRFDKAASMIQSIDTANELKMGGNFGFIMRPEVQGGMRRERILQYAAQPIGQGMPLSMATVLMSNQQLEQQIGYKIRTTTNLSAAVTQGTSTTSSNVIFGNWKQLYIGFWRGMEIRISDQASDASGNSAFLKDQFFLLAIQETDSNVGRVTAFTVVDDAETTEASW